jgi:RNA polymerase sigma factor (sigma-70 family)
MEPNTPQRTIRSVNEQPSDVTDWALARAGEGEAFGRIFDRHRDRVLRHSRRLVTVAADADDVLAITFLEAWRNRSRVRMVDDSVLPWLLVTATNVAHNTNRAARRYRALLSRLPPADPTTDHLVGDEALDAIRALAGLSLADRRVVALCILEGYSEREAADLIGVPPGTIKSRLSRAKQRMREHLSPLELTHPAEEAGL